MTIGCLAVGLLLLAGFVVAEQRSSHPLLPLRVILDRARGGSYVAVGLGGIAIFGAEAVSTPGYRSSPGSRL